MEREKGLRDKQKQTQHHFAPSLGSHSSKTFSLQMEKGREKEGERVSEREKRERELVKERKRATFPSVDL